MLPDFEKGESLEALHAKGALDAAWSAFGANAPAVWKRPLHAHQHEAMARRENYLVATGTGSGKTESFLYPLVDDILAQGDLKRPGVRAILVYPLNALANDQLNRIAALLFRDLGDPGITLGRYTGQVKARATRAEEVTRLRASPSFIDAFGEDAEVPAHWLLVAGGDAGDPAAYPDHQLCDARAYPALADQPAAAGERRPLLDRARRDPHLHRRPGDRGLLPAAAAEGASRPARRPGALRRHLGLARSGAQGAISPTSPSGSSASPSPARRRSSPRSGSCIRTSRRPRVRAGSRPTAGRPPASSPHAPARRPAPARRCRSTTGTSRPTSSAFPSSASTRPAASGRRSATR